jgi:hypothetical protein
MTKSAAARIVFTPTNSKSYIEKSRENSIPISPPARKSASIAIN